MAKDLQWFKFSPLNWMTGRIRKESEKIQIAFLELMCQYWKNGCQMTIEQAELEIGDKIHALLKKKIVKSSDTGIKIDFLDDQMGSIEDTSVLRRNAALSRWNAKSSTSNASAMQVHASAMQNDADKIRQDKTRGEERENIAQSIFSDEQFMEGLGRSHKGKDYKKAFEECWLFHTQNGGKFESWEWRKKLISWLGNVKTVNGVGKNPSKIH